MRAAVRVPPEKQPQLLGHPIGLFVLFLTEMWERFSFYGMRGLLRAYMVYYLFSTAGRLVYPGANAPVMTELPVDLHHVIGWNFIRSLYADKDVKDFASHIYGLYTALVYATPFFGGIIADRYVGRYKSVIIGAIVMALGHFVMASDRMMFIALGLLIVGNGFFKPNISVQVGDLYPKGDDRHDRAYTIFYMGINLGATICNIVCATLAATLGWEYGFGAAGVGLCIGLVIYIWGSKYLPEDSFAKSETTQTKSVEPLTATHWKAIWALLALCVLNIAFWMVYEQQGNSMQAWSDTKTVWPTVFGFHIPQAWFQSFNPFMIILIAPLLDRLWKWQKDREKEPSTVVKMAIGSFLLGASFIVMAIGAHLIGSGKGSLFWPFFCTLILTIGELYLSPIGMALVKEVSPARIVSMMMGLWLASSFIGNYLAGELGTFYNHLPPETFFLILCAIGMCTGIAMWLFNKPLKKALGQ